MAKKIKYDPKTFKHKTIDLGSQPSTSSTYIDDTMILIDIASGWSWISFPYHLSSYLLSDIIPPSTYPSITTIKTAGFGGATASTIVSGAWVGSISSITNYKGYQVYNEGQPCTLEISTPDGYGCLYGDTDLKWDLAGGLNMVSFPFLDDTSISDSFAFTNQSVALSGGSTGTLLDGVMGEGVAMDFIDNNWEGSLATEGFRVNKSYYLDVITQPASEPFRYFKDPTPSVGSWDGSDHPIDGDNKYFHYYTGELLQQMFIGCWMFYIRNADGTLSRHEPFVDWIGVYRGERCVGSCYMQENDWTADSNGSLTAVGTDMAWSVATQYFNNSHQGNCRVGDMPRLVFWSSANSKYYICKWYDTQTQTILEWLDPLGDGVHADVGVYMGGLSPYANHFSNNHKVLGDGNANWFIPNHARFALIALDPDDYNW